MPRHFEKRSVPYTPAQMYALVADVESYPVFLPWCLGCEIKERNGDSMKADLIVGTKAFQDRFTSIVNFEAPRAIRVEYGGGPLAHLRNEWTFAETENGGCELSFFVDFAPRSRLIGVMIDVFFDKAFRKMAAAFEKRARALYD